MVKRLKRLENLENISTEEKFITRFADILKNIIFMSPIDRSDSFGQLMDKARELNCFETAYSSAQKIAEEMGEPELFETPESFEKTIPLTPFPLSSLPDILAKYLKAVAENVQVYPEMCALPMLSVLSLCCQGKFEVRFPNSTHKEPLNIYTVTVAKPGERKSGVFRSFIYPLIKYQREENKRREPLITDFKTKSKILSKSIEKATTKGDTALASQLTLELNELEPVHRLNLNITDCTPESLAFEMAENDEIMGILDDECGIFDQIAGLYTNGISNIDIFLKSYDGSQYTVTRRTKENIYLESPLITLGLMSQPEAFQRAMKNPQFIGRGLIHRFLFAFPESMQGFRTQYSKSIPTELENKYNELIIRLLTTPKNDEPFVLGFNKKASLLLKDYFDFIEDRLKKGGSLEYMAEWANKLYAKCIRITGLLHLCEHSYDELIDEKTTQTAILIAMWAENQAHRVFENTATEDITTTNAKYILSKIKNQKISFVTSREILRICRKIKNADELQEALELLEDMKYIREIPQEYSGTGRKPSPKYKVNQLIYDKDFNKLSKE